MNRRELLKYFVGGAAVVPIVGQQPMMAAQATLVEPPKVELVPEMIVPIEPKRAQVPGWDRRDVVHMTVSYVTEDGMHHTFEADTMLTRMDVKTMPIRSWHGNVVDEAVISKRLRYELHGECVRDSKTGVLAFMNDWTPFGHKMHGISVG